MFSALSAAELLVRFDLVVLLDVVEDAVELVVAHLVAEFAPALDEEHFVDGVDQQLGCHVVEHPAQLGVVGLGIDDVPGLAEGGDLAVLEVGLGEDLAVHLHDDLLDDFAAKDGARGEAEGEDQCRDGGISVFHC